MFVLICLHSFKFKNLNFLKEILIPKQGSDRTIYASIVSTSHEQTIDSSVNSSFDQIDVDVWRVCMDSKMSDMLRFYWSAVYLIGFVLPLVAVVVSYKELFQRVRDTE